MKPDPNYILFAVDRNFRRSWHEPANWRQKQIVECLPADARRFIGFFNYELKPDDPKTYMRTRIRRVHGLVPTHRYQYEPTCRDWGLSQLSNYYRNSFKS